MKHLFIVNPVAGKCDRTDEIIAKLKPYREKYDIEVAVTQAPRHAEKLVRDAAADGKDLRVYACGGDGTFNEVSAGAVGLRNVAVTSYPLGSGNDFVKLFSDGGRSFYNVDNLINDTGEASFDVIGCNDRIGANICSVGIDARIGTQIEKYKRWPLVTGTMAYYISTLVNVIKGIHEHYVVDIDGRVFDRRFSLICVANGRCYGSTFKPLPEAEPDDGVLDVLLVRAVSRLKVASVIGKYAAGRHSELPGIIEHHRCRSITITCDRESPVNIDGELMLAKEVHMRVEPKALRVFYPKGLTWTNSPVAMTAEIIKNGA